MPIPPHWIRAERDIDKFLVAGYTLTQHLRTHDNYQSPCPEGRALKGPYQALCDQTKLPRNNYVIMAVLVLDKQHVQLIPALYAEGPTIKKQRNSVSTLPIE